MYMQVADNKMAFLAGCGNVIHAESSST